MDYLNIAYSLLAMYIATCIDYAHIIMYCSIMAQHKRLPTEVSLHVIYVHWLCSCEHM